VHWAQQGGKMRTLTIILIASIFVCLGVLSVEAKKPSVLKDNDSTEFCNPSNVAVPAVGTPKSFTISNRANIEVKLRFLQADKWNTGNEAEIRSPQPFRCYKYYYFEPWSDAPQVKETEEAEYGDVPTPKGWYFCSVSMRWGDHRESWEFQLIPSQSNQLFVVEGYWVEED
jgi:hypothetical protein